MKIICEHCGTNIDLDKDKVCPNCKAPYSRNKDYKEYKERLKKEKDTDLRSKELDNELKEKTKDIMDTSLKTFKSTFTISKIMFAVVGIIILAIMTIVIINIINFNNDYNDTRDEINNTKEMIDSRNKEFDDQYNKIKEELEKQQKEFEENYNNN